jgi:hypothetical protein
VIKLISTSWNKRKLSRLRKPKIEGEKVPIMKTEKAIVKVETTKKGKKEPLYLKQPQSNWR